MEDAAEFFSKGATAVGWVSGSPRPACRWPCWKQFKKKVAVSTWPDPTWGWGNAGAGGASSFRSPQIAIREWGFCTPLGWGPSWGVDGQLQAGQVLSQTEGGPWGGMHGWDTLATTSLRASKGGSARASRTAPGWQLGADLCGRGGGISDPVRGSGLQTNSPLLPSQWTAGNSITPSPLGPTPDY